MSKCCLRNLELCVVVRCSYSPSILHSCVIKQRWLSAEVSEVFHGWSVKAPSPRKWYMVGHQTMCEDGWWEIGCTSGLAQIKTGEETQQVKGKKQDKTENELMDRMTRRERTETVEEMDPEQIKKSEGTMERAVQGTFFLYNDSRVDKQEMMENEMMNLMRTEHSGRYE